MSKFTFIETGIKDLYVIEPTVFGDNRGYFMETYNDEFKPYIKHLDGSPAEFVQDNQSKSKKGVLRGLHFQKNNPQGKLVRCLEGEVYDVAVDLRKDSETYGNGTAFCSPRKTRSSSIFPRALLTALRYIPTPPHSHTSAPVFMIPPTKAVLCGMTLILVLTGTYLRVWMYFSAKRTRKIPHSRIWISASDTNYFRDLR